ncbi:acylphosphatase-1-like [Leucoraja erinacea]|uniref:acylphosphatase-1-like n=1 Tax=Leucoraja erinaceus TaxID=7782 RepID=UPI0024540C66|nr:acylphosphatase-1-like [Leucoraja erinacea]
MLPGPLLLQLFAAVSMTTVGLPGGRPHSLSGKRRLLRAGAMASGGEGRLLSVDYEVFGKVQGVFFRKHTQKEAKRLGLVGWVRNTERGTVEGRLQGAEQPVRTMQAWLRAKGSPRSRIDKAEFSNQRPADRRDYPDFQVVK